jgi:hypothetical protein
MDRESVMLRCCTRGVDLLIDIGFLCVACREQGGKISPIVHKVACDMDRLESYI